jgi:hypothetical protein
MEQLAKGFSPQVFHDDEVLIPFLPHMIDGYDVGVIQPCRCLGLLLKAKDDFIF